MKNFTASSAFTDTKPHYELLDGLRGVAPCWSYSITSSKDSPLPEEEH